MGEDQANNNNLSETVESRRIPQDIKAARQLMKVSDENSKNASNHIFASIYSFFQLEYLSLKSELNSTALRAKLYLAANRAAFVELENLKVCFAMKF